MHGNQALITLGVTMAIPREWASANVGDLRHLLRLTKTEWRLAKEECESVYIEREAVDEKTGKRRKLCSTPRKSLLRRVHVAIKRKILAQFELSDAIRGYQCGSDNIKVAREVCAHQYVGKLDISKFHPNIKTAHVAVAFRKHGLSWQWARHLARLVTFRGRVPQGATTSNHIANLVLDLVMRHLIIPLATRHGVFVINYGDDIALCGSDPKSVRKCVRRAKRAIQAFGFQTNDKCRDCEDRSGDRTFVGCSTARNKPDYPRRKYREFRKELRSLLQREHARDDLEPRTTQAELLRLKCRIAYVRRLNSKKGRNLQDVYYRLCAARRSMPVAPHQESQISRGS
jgi:RNA-directed DNA polymerase